MSKIDSAIYEIHTMDALAERDQWVNRLHPLVKFIITLFYIVLVVSFDKYDVIGLAGMVVYPIILFTIAELSFRESLKRLRIVLPFVCFVGIFNPFFDKTPLFSLGGITITTGMVSMITLMVKGILTVLASYLLIATTSIEKICYAMRLLHIPAILVTQVLLTYRYITVLLQEANRITQAYSLRAPNQKGVHYKVWGSLAGQLLLRSMDRASEVYESMCLRGYKGEFYYQSRIKCGKKDVLYLLIWAGVLVFLRLVPIMAVVGNLVMN